MSTADNSAPVGAPGGTPQQQNQAPNANQMPPQSTTPVQSVAQANVGGDSLTCQWQSCGERCATAEQLYDHVCERHVGRKSTNNLNLTCQWGNCRTTTVKRDHITSHIRVHVPLKPHKCDFCGKAFKRPQDLKKHVKTHADDSVLLRSPQPDRANQNGPGGGYQPANSNKLVADLQTLAATASGYYPDHGLSGAGGYYQNGNAQGPYHNAPAAPQGSAYGPVYYAVNQPTSMSNDYEVRKRAAFDALNEFFGDAKRRIIDPSTYYDVGHRLMALQGVQLPMLGTVGGGYSGSDSYGGGMAAPAAHLPHQHYTLPLPNLRTKNDLLNIDQFLEQLQSTVYENSQQAAAAGVAQAGSHYVHPGLNYGRSSNSPPSVGQAPSHAGGLNSSHASALAPIAAPATETPALTPASSVMSYTSNNGQSPGSNHSGSNISPSRVPNAGLGGSMYPTLPAVSAMGDINSSGYSTSGAPASSLASGFDSDGRRRYSGSLLQRQAPERHGSYDERMDEDTPTQSPKAPHSGDGSNSPSSPSAEERGRQLGRDIGKMNIMSPSMIDPAMRSPGDKSDEHETGTPNRDDADNKQEAWVENIRMIEMLKDYVKSRLERQDYDEDEAAEAAGKDNHVHEDKMDEDMKTEDQRDAESLYPVLRAVQGES
ncbi:hypothetical protein NA57DRAFT_73286 [Rhizodiscina lignyota]|uniref:C2H2-type domain-containing protein n=1 Tax=Rhizodiscina lignyota TaxID=1504668 RepID=A0A9P4M8M7_9PEZI|nr:hypothetical protein NA57DRAFT_73286 [Rhizodiscina lignyota]